MHILLMLCIRLFELIFITSVREPVTTEKGKMCNIFFIFFFFFCLTRPTRIDLNLNEQCCYPYMV